MKRRNFISLSAAGMAAVGFPALYYGCGNSVTDESLAPPDLLSHLWDPLTLVEVGESYRNQNAGEDSERTLAKLILSGNSNDYENIIGFLNEKIQQDYISGSIVMVDGWFLSVTEARQCALFSLIQSN